MNDDTEPAGPPAHRPYGTWFVGLTVVRTLVLGAAVFTVSTIAGMLLSGASPAGADTAPVEPVATISLIDDVAGLRTAVDPQDPAFARSMIFSGVAGLAVSIAGMAIVTRRRRIW